MSERLLEFLLEIIRYADTDSGHPRLLIKNLKALSYP
jgi:hypothetical protein